MTKGRSGSYVIGVRGQLLSRLKPGRLVELYGKVIHHHQPAQTSNSGYASCSSFLAANTDGR